MKRMDLFFLFEVNFPILLMWIIVTVVLYPTKAPPLSNIWLPAATIAINVMGMRVG